MIVLIQMSYAYFLTARWKQPLMFFFSENAAPARELHFLLHHALDSLVEVGLNPAAIVCDQGSCNRSLYRMLGVTCVTYSIYCSDL